MGLYSVGSVLLYAPVVGQIVATQRPQFASVQWLALLATATLHPRYSLTLQAGYRAADLSVVYPLARVAGPLLSFVAAVVLLDEQVTMLSILGVVLVVSGILLVAGLTRNIAKVQSAAIAYGLATGAFIAAFTVNDGWSVKCCSSHPLSSTSPAICSVC